MDYPYDITIPPGELALADADTAYPLLRWAGPQVETPANQVNWNGSAPLIITISP